MTTPRRELALAARQMIEILRRTTTEWYPVDDLFKNVLAALHLSLSAECIQEVKTSLLDLIREGIVDVLVETDRGPTCRLIGSGRQVARRTFLVTPVAGGAKSRLIVWCRDGQHDHPVRTVMAGGHFYGAKLVYESGGEITTIGYDGTKSVYTKFAEVL